MKIFSDLLKIPGNVLCFSFKHVEVFYVNPCYIHFLTISYCEFKSECLMQGLLHLLVCLTCVQFLDK